MRRSGVRFISPAPIAARKARYQNGSGLLLFRGLQATCSNAMRSMALTGVPPQVDDSKSILFLPRSARAQSIKSCLTWPSTANLPRTVEATMNRSRPTAVWASCWCVQRAAARRAVADSLLLLPSHALISCAAAVDFALGNEGENPRRARVALRNVPGPWVLIDRRGRAASEGQQDE